MKIALVGYGKMGRTIEKIAIKEKIEIVCIISSLDQLQSILKINTNPRCDDKCL